MGAMFQKKISPLETYKPTTCGLENVEYLDWVAHPALTKSKWSSVKTHVKHYRNLKSTDFDLNLVKCVLFSIYF